MERDVRSDIPPGAALAHLLLFLLLRYLGAREILVGSWILAGSATLAAFLLRDFALPGRKDRFPETPSLLAWAGAVALELHAFYPAVAESRVVPSALFVANGFLLPPFAGAAYSILSLGCLTATTNVASTGPATIAGLVVLSILGHAVGMTVRSRRTRDAGGKNAFRLTLEEGESFIVPRRRNDERHDGLLKESAEQLRILHSGAWIKDSIRRVLEGLLTVTEATAVCYVSRSRGADAGFRIRVLACGAGATVREGPGIPGDYPPVREPLDRRIRFVSEGESCGAFALDAFGSGKMPSAMASVPVIVEGRVEGVLLAYRDDGAAWNGAVVHWMETGGYFVANEIVRERQWFQVIRFVEEHVGFLRYAKRLFAVSENVPESGDNRCVRRLSVYRETAEGIRQLLCADRVLLLETENGNGTGTARVAWESAKDVSGPRDSPFTLAETYAGWVVGKNAHRIFSGAPPGTQRHPILPEELDDRREENFLLFPVCGVQGFTGVLVCAAGPERAFDGVDVDTVKAALDLMRMGISEAMREEILHDGATTDGLTGLLNHRTFRSRLGSVLERLDGRHPSAVLMLDIDHFKNVNDTHGHPGGDEVLRSVSAVIRKTVRKGDFAGRYGGEEFAVFLHLTDTAQAFRAAERLRSIIRKTTILIDGKTVGVTVSLGVACSPANGRTADEILANADSALYRSKRGGRDRVTLFDPTLLDPVD